MREYFAALETHLAEAHRQAVRLVRRQATLGSSLAEFGTAMIALGKCGRFTAADGICGTATAFSHGLTQWQAASHLLCCDACAGTEAVCVLHGNGGPVKASSDEKEPGVCCCTPKRPLRLVLGLQIRDGRVGGDIPGDGRAGGEPGPAPARAGSHTRRLLRGALQGARPSDIASLVIRMRSGGRSGHCLPPRICVTLACMPHMQTSRCMLTGIKVKTRDCSCFLAETMPSDGIGGSPCDVR